MLISSLRFTIRIRLFIYIYDDQGYDGNCNNDYQDDHCYWNLHLNINHYKCTVIIANDTAWIIKYINKINERHFPNIYCIIYQIQPLFILVAFWFLYRISVYDWKINIQCNVIKGGSDKLFRKIWKSCGAMWEYLN